MIGSKYIGIVFSLAPKRRKAEKLYTRFLPMKAGLESVEQGIQNILLLTSSHQRPFNAKTKYLPVMKVLKQPTKK